MQNSATINSVVTQGGTINSTVTVGSTIQSTLTGGGIGPKGDTGPAGDNGTVWHEAGGAPTIIYADGDYYLNTTNGDVYVQTGGAWGSPVGNIQGPPGPEGAFPYTNVSDYGAVGDGTTDDTTAITNAIDAATLHGGTVFFPTPAVRYNISAALTLTTGVSILGTGSEACEIYQTSSTVDGIDANDAASISIQGIYLNGPGAGTGVGINMGWTSAGNVPFLDFRDLKVYNFGSDGMAIETPIVSNFTQVVCKSNGGYGTNFYHAGTSCVFNDCWMRENALAGYHFYESVYMSLNGCAADGNGVGYLVENAQSINFNGCGAESQVVGSGIWDGTGFKISNSSVIGLHNVWLTNNPAIGIWITNGSIACEVFGAADNSPGGTATAFVQTDVSTNSTLSDIHNTTANNYSPGTVTILNDGANNLTTKQATIKDASGSLILTATSDGAGGQYSLQADTTGIIDIFGQGGQTLNVNLLDGYLQLTPLTATTVPYLDANKRFVSSAITPTQLGYLSSGTGVTGSGNLMFGTSPTASSLTVNTLLTANTQISLVGTSGTLEFTAATDGGDFNILSTATGTKTLAIYGSSSNTLNLNLLDGALYMGSNLTISNAGVATNLTYDTAGTGNVFKINGTAISAVTGTGAVVLATVTSLSSLTAHGTITSGGLGTGAVIGGVTMTLGSDASYDLYYRNSSGVLTRLGMGTTGQYLAANTSGAPTWGTPSGSGMTNPMTTLGDIIYENATPAAARLAGNTSATIAVLTQTGNGTISAAPVWTTTTGTGSVVLATSPSLTTPNIGVATATSLNKVTITAPGTSATLTLITGSSLITAGAFSQTHTATATTNSTYPAGTHTLAGLDVVQSWTAVQTFSSAPVFNALPTGTAVSSAEAVSTLVSRDANGNAAVTNLQQGYTSTATATGTTTLTVASNQNQVFTGTLGQICILPAVSTLTLGTDYVITNQSTGAITVQSSGANNIVVLAPGQIATVVSNATSGTGAAVWNVSVVNAHYDVRNNNGTNATEINSLMETGWVNGVIGAAAHIQIAVTFGHTYATAPIVVAGYGGDATSATTYGSGSNTVKGPVACKATDITTTGCNIWIHSSDGTSWSAGNVVFAQFIVVGV